MYKIICSDGKEYGPVSADTLRQWVAEGRVNISSQVQREGSTEWVPLGQLPEFVQAFIAPAPGFTPPAALGPQTSALAIAGMILGIVSLMSVCCCYGVPFNIAAIICSAIALMQIRKEPQRYTGHGLATTGLVLGIFSVVLALVLLILGVAVNWQDVQKQIHQ